MMSKIIREIKIKTIKTQLSWHPQEYGYNGENRIANVNADMETLWPSYTASGNIEYVQQPQKMT